MQRFVLLSQVIILATVLTSSVTIKCVKFWHRLSVVREICFISAYSNFFFFTTSFL
jgi:hypothetical protein